MPTVVGLDVALAKTGICGIYGGTYTSKGGNGDARLDRLYRDVLSHATHADLAVIEDLPMQGHSAALVGRAQGVVRLALYRLEVPVVSVVPSTLKKWATGNGKASKEDMWEHLPAVHKRVISPKATDEVDAFWLRELGLAYVNHQPVPEAVDWSAWDGWFKAQED